MLKLLKAKHLKAPTKENPKDPTYLGKRRLYLVSKSLLLVVPRLFKPAWTILV
jgi:hypothetical protein